MTAGLVVLLALAGGAGAASRYLVDRAVTLRTGGFLPWGTFTVNVVGSFLLGLLVGLEAAGRIGHGWLTVAGTGFCGAFTTFSTFALETVTLARDGRRAIAAANVGGSVVCGLAAAGLALALVG